MTLEQLMIMPLAFQDTESGASIVEVPAVGHQALGKSNQPL
jgi:hypothetical protein